MAKKYKIVAITQMYNELRKGNLERYFKHAKNGIDEVVVYDDASTDGSWEYAQKFTPHVLRGQRNNFADEWHHKKALLEKALELKPDFILSLDADEVVSEAGVKLQELAAWMEEKDLDGVRLRDINLWRSGNWARTDSDFDSANFLRFWRVKPGMVYTKPKTGLHQSPAPDTVVKVKDTSLVCLLHYGFANDRSIVAKYLTYAEHGQKGPDLSRLIDESNLQLRKVDAALFPAGLKVEDPRPAARPFIDWLKLAEQFRPELLRPAVSIICLIYQSVKWLEFTYNQVQKYTDMHDKEFFFVANDATTEVKAYLKNNYIPHYIFENSAEQKKDWYINNVYRAYNFGAEQARGDYLLFINSDMGFSPGWVEGLLGKTDGKNCVAANFIGCGKFIVPPPNVTKNFGQLLEEYREEEFLDFAANAREDKLVEPRTFMPMIINRDVFLRVGGYPEGNVLRGSDIHKPIIAKKGEDLIAGDVAFVQKLAKTGIKHQTSLLSVVYHFEQGEMTDFVEKNSGGKNAETAIVNSSIHGGMGEKIVWDFMLEFLPGMTWVDAAMINGENNFEEKAKNYLVQNYPKLKIIIQNASFTDLVDQSKFTIAFLQDALRLMNKSSLQQENNLDGANLLVANSLYTAAAYPEYPFKIIPIGVNDKLFCPGDQAQARQRNGIPNGKVGIFVGDLSEVKGWQEVKKVIDSRSGVTFIVVSKDLETYNGANVLMFNRVSQEKLADLHRCADFFIVGSPVETECLAAVEACLTNVPVIMKPVGIFADLTLEQRDKCGIFGPNFGQAVDDIFIKQFSPREVMLEKKLNIEGMIDRWWNLLAEVKQKRLGLVGEGAISPAPGFKKKNFRRKLRMVMMNKTYLTMMLKRKLPLPAYNFLLKAWRAGKNTKRAIINIFN